MNRIRVLVALAAVVASAGGAGAQSWSGRTGATLERHGAPPETHQGSGGGWTGTASKWGGSPAVQRSHERDRCGCFIAGGAYLTDAVATPAPAQVVYIVDTVHAPAAAPPVEMKVVTAPHEERQLTTMEVYRLQPRFRKP